MLFNQLDRNADGQLTANELPNLNILPPQIRAVLQAADKNGDGAISREEFVGSFPGRPGPGPGGNGPPGPPGAGPSGNAPGAGVQAGFGRAGGCGRSTGADQDSRDG